MYFLKSLLVCFELVSTYHSKLIICGDFNIHVDDLANAASHRLLDLLDAFGLVQHVTGPTQVGHHTLDLIITRADWAPSDVQVNPPAFSDHSLIICSFALARPALAVQQHIIRRLNAIDSDAFINAVRQSPICVNVMGTDNRTTAELCTLYNDSLRKVLDDLAPPVTITTSSRHSSPWFNVSAVHLVDVYAHWSVATGVLVCLLITFRGLLLLKKNLYSSRQKSKHIRLAGSVTALAILLGCGVV
jgi:hypothetical protein